MSCETKKRTKVLLIVLGIVLIVVGLVVAHLMLNIIAKKVRGNNCLPTSESSPNYKAWTAKSVRKTEVTFWNITNKDELLYEGKLPKFEEKGPYIYTTTTQKVEISFDAGQVTYKDFTTQEFDETLTREKCPSCYKTDEVTLLNTAYMALMAQFKGDIAFSLFMIPNIVNGYLPQLFDKLKTKEIVYSYLGNHKATAAQKSEPAFGPWLGSNSFEASLVNGTRGGNPYNWTEMMGLYNVLGNSSLLLPPPSVVDPFAKGMGLLTYLKTYLVLAETHAATSNATVKASLNAQMRTLQTNMNDLVCSSSSLCFQVNNTLTVKALAEFITSHLAAGSIAFIDDNKYGLIVTRSVHDFALGYTMTKLPLPPLFPNGVPVPGILENHTSEADAKNRGKAVALHTCESSGIPSTFSGYDGKTSVPQEYFPKATTDELKVSGFSIDQFTTTTKFSMCSSKYPATAPHFDMFVGSIYQTMRVKYQESVPSHGIHMNRYVLDENEFKINNKTVFTVGILDISNIQGIPVSVSAPGFLYCPSRVYKPLGMAEPDFNAYGSIIDIEPVTGKAMNVFFRTQVNSAITKDMISAVRFKPFNITFYDSTAPYTKHFPLYWTNEGGQLTKQQATFLQDELFSAFGTSCALGITLPILGGLLLVTGIVLSILAILKSASVTQVMPASPDPNKATKA